MKQTFTFYEKADIVQMSIQKTRPDFLRWFGVNYPNAHEVTVREVQLEIWKIKIKAARRTDRMHLRALRNVHHTPEEIKALEDLIANFPYVNKVPTVSTPTVSAPDDSGVPFSELPNPFDEPLFSPEAFASSLPSEDIPNIRTDDVLFSLTLRELALVVVCAMAVIGFIWSLNL